MIKSMTGYGKAEAASENGKFTVEIRAVNHRYNEMSVKLPRPLLQFENEVRKCVAERLKRGKIEVFIQQELTAGAGIQLQPDLALAQAYYDAIEGVRNSLGLQGPVPLSLVVSQKDVLVARESTTASDKLQGDLLTVVREAVESLESMRMREGEVLARDVGDRRVILARLIDAVSARAPQAVAECAVRLKERVAQLAGEVPVDEARLAQEIAILADRGDITEELVRFGSHLQQLDQTLTLDEPVGRKLDFLMQELNREINTIGSKANDGEIAALVVQVKAELERIREQVQNIE